MSGFASGAHALGLCDVCGFTYKLTELRDVYNNGHRTGSKACPDCWDPDHPQNFVGRLRVDDPQSLRNPRPDSGRLSSIGLFGWDPVGHETMMITFSAGTVTVTTS